MVNSIQTRLLKFLKHEDALVVFVSWTLLFQLGFLLLIYFPLEQSPDIQTYLSLSQFDFDQSPIRRYRILIPMLAHLVQLVFGPLIENMRPWSFSGDFSLCMSFLLVNAIFMTASSFLMYKLCRFLKFSKIASGTALLAFLTCRWTIELTALPLVDSLFYFSIIATLYGFLSMRTGWMLAGIFAGPWAKESYIFFVPLLFVLKGLGRWRTFIYLGLSGILVFSFRYVYDALTGFDMLTNIRKDFSSIETLPSSLQRMFSFHGLYEIFSVCGFWIFIPFLACMMNRCSFLDSIRKHLQWMVCFLLIVIVQALLSADLGRMYFLSFPVLAI